MKTPPSFTLSSFARLIILVFSLASLHANGHPEQDQKIAELERKLAATESVRSNQTPSPTIVPATSQWRKLQLGMATAEVIAILGPPPRLQVLHNIMFTYHYGKEGFVSFSKDKVSGWREPEL